MRKIYIPIVAALLGVALAPGAQAHSSVIETTPMYKSTLTLLPESVSIRFSEPPLEIEGKVVNTISVSSPDGAVISSPTTTIKGSTLAVSLVPSATQEDGTYSVRYRMASADGHVISGNYEFYLGAPSPTSTTAVVEDQGWWGEHFFHNHEGHIYYALGVLAVAGAWLIWHRRRQSL